jgi:hypothetical protein
VNHRCRQHRATWEILRFRLIRETERYLNEGRRQPEYLTHIPTIRVGFGRFPPGLAERYWSTVLETRT